MLSDFQLVLSSIHAPKDLDEALVRFSIVIYNWPCRIGRRLSDNTGLVIRVMKYQTTRLPVSSYHASQARYEAVVLNALFSLFLLSIYYERSMCLAFALLLCGN